MVEPQVACAACRTTYSLEEGASTGMRCHRCGGALVSVDAEAFADDVEAYSSGNNEREYLGGREEVAELQLPAHNEVDAEAVSQFIASLPVPISLEIYGEGDRRAMLVRGEEDNIRSLAGNIQAIWSRADLQILKEDPLTKQGTNANGREQGFSFKLAAPPYLPIKIWQSFGRGDPVNMLLSSVGNLAATELVLLQIMISRKGKPGWLEVVQRRLKLEAQRGYTTRPEGSPGTANGTYTHAPAQQETTPERGFAYLLILLLAFVSVIVGLHKSIWLFAAMALPIIVLGGLLWRYLERDEDPWQEANLDMVSKKVVDQDAFFLVHIRVHVRADTYERVKKLAGRIRQALSQYEQAGGNRLKASADPFEMAGPWTMPDGEDENAMWLGSDEIAGLWHPPIVSEQMSPGLVPVRGVEMRAPDPEDVRGFYGIGSYQTPGGGSKPVRISSAALRRNVFCIGKPGTGKSTLMHHITAAGMRDEEKQAVIVVDPHGDLVNQIIGSVREEDIERIRIMDVADKEFLLPFNPLDVHRTGWEVVQVGNAIVDIGRSLWSDYWGPRMQIPLKRGVHMLAAANEMRRPGESLGLSQLAALLNADREVRERFLRTELEGSPHRKALERYFLGDYEKMTQHFREQVISPVLSKSHRFEEEPMLPLFSCPASKLDIAEVIRSRQVLLIHTGMNKYGAEISDFAGSMIINSVLRELVHQGDLSPEDRVRVMLIIDEFQTFTGVTWPELVQQTRKYGGQMVLGTQSLASLRKQDRDIPGIILSGVYSMFAFAMNGEDAEYISRLELSGGLGGPSADTLAGLDLYAAYAKLVREDNRLGRPFYFLSAPAPDSSPFIAERVWKRRAEYSLPYEAAYKKALDMIGYFDRYGLTALSSGVGLARRRGEEQATSTQASSILLDKAGAELSAIGEAARVGLPWEDERDDEEGEPGSGGAAGEAEDVLLGKEIAEDWRETALREIEEEDEEQDGEAPK
ncbi:MAG: type IV secretion system DNA-binding domain-containing protein [Anaerolineales bacterium]|nr:type IV secretion system DNA-binding domain-containing protein [Anaerolineales bacterium]